MNMKKNGYKQYQKTVKSTTDKKKIVLMLYDGAILFLKKAIIAIEENKNVEKMEKINRVIAILSELASSLDMANGGEIAVNLLRLYDFMIDYLYQANSENDINKINRVISLLSKIREGWATIIAENGKSSEKQKDEASATDMRAEVAV